MTFTTAEMARIRRKTGGSASTLPDATLDDMYTQISSFYYPDYSGKRDVWVQAAVVMVLREKLAAFTTTVTYQEAGAMEKLSDVFDNIKAHLALEEKELDDTIEKADGATVARTFSFRQIPSSPKDEPTS